MKYLFLLLFLLCSCSKNQNAKSNTNQLAEGGLYSSNIKIGDEWSAVKSKLKLHGWVKINVAFELEKTFQDKGGEMFLYKHSGSSGLYFATVPKNKIRYLSAMNPIGGDTMGGELKILEILAE